MSELCLGGVAPQSPAGRRAPRRPQAAGRTAGWWAHIRDRLTPSADLVEDAALDDRLLDDIGLSRADVAALKL